MSNSKGSRLTPAQIKARTRSRLLRNLGVPKFAFKALTPEGQAAVVASAAAREDERVEGEVADATVATTDATSRSDLMKHLPLVLGGLAVAFVIVKIAQSKSNRE